MATDTFLKVLYDGAVSANPSDTVDFVAVHGLNPFNKPDHAYKTWTHETGKMWLKDFLPEKLPSARIMLFGYNSNVAFDTSRSNLREHADDLLDRLEGKRTGDTECENRPIIFIGHSLGGLLIKQVLVKARNTDKYSSILKSTYGMVFFGTPHRGGEGTSLGSVAASVAKFVLRNPSNSLMESLKKESFLADMLNEDFANQYERYQIVSFYETKPMRKTRNIVVEKRSALLGLSVEREKALPISADHSNICKFADAGGDDYEPVQRNIFRLAEDAVKRFGELQTQETQSPARATVRPLPPKRHSTIPSTKVSYFTGRHDLLQLLKQRLKLSVHANPMSQPPVVPIYGMAGIGKTQLVLEYLSKHGANYRQTFWIDATDKDSLGRDFERIAVKVNLVKKSDLEDSADLEHYSKMIETGKNWLEEATGGSWLLVFDNVDSNMALSNVREAMPQLGGGAVILIGRLRDSHDLGFNNAIDVKEMSEEDAIELLLSRANSKREQPFQNVKTNSDYILAQKIVKSLGFLPLALDLAGAYINSNSHTLDEYFRLYNETLDLERVIDHKPTVWNYDKPVLTTWGISFRAVKNKSPYAAELLLLMGYFHHDNITGELLERASVNWESKGKYQCLSGTRDEEEALRLLCAMFSSTTGGRETQILTKALVTLSSYSLLRKRDDVGNFTLHPLVRLWSHNYSLAHGQSWRFRLALFLLAASIPEKISDSNRQFLREIIVHLNILREESKEWKAIEMPDIELVSKFEPVYVLCGRWKEAENIGIIVLERRKQVLGETHPDTLTSMSDLATTYRLQSRWKEAEELGEKAVVGRKTFLGESNPDTLTSMDNLASTYRSQGRWKEAEQLGLQVFNKRKEVLGESHPDVLTSMANLAWTYGSQGRWKEAKRLEVQVLAMRKNQDMMHPDTLKSMANLASTYGSRRRWKEAEELGVQVVDARKEVLGENHPDTLTSISNLAAVYGSQGRLTDAVKLQSEVITAKKEVLGEDHHETLLSISNLVTSYYLQGRSEEARELGTKVVDTAVNSLGKEHPDTLMLMANLAGINSSQRRWKEAEELETQVVDGRKKILGMEHPDTKRSIINLRAYKILSSVAEKKDRVLKFLHLR